MPVSARRRLVVLELAALTTVAERYGRGRPTTGSDEFDYRGAPDPATWTKAGECWSGHAGNGRR